jgi:hypothetical protein
VTTEFTIDGERLYYRLQVRGATMTVTMNAAEARLFADELIIEKFCVEGLIEPGPSPSGWVLTTKGSEALVASQIATQQSELHVRQVPPVIGANQAIVVEDPEQS